MLARVPVVDVVEAIEGASVPVSVEYSLLLLLGNTQRLLFPGLAFSGRDLNTFFLHESL